MTFLQMFMVFVMELFCVILGYPSGPPKTEFVCRDMFPVGHGVDAQSNNPPYSLKLSQNVYTPWEELRITISANPTEVMRGLFIQARRADCNHRLQKEPVGVFQLFPNESYLQTIQCLNKANSSIAHRSNPGLLNAVFKWYAPAVRVGHIYFVATVVSEKTTFWTTIYSEILRDLSSDSDASTCPARVLLDSTMPQITTTKPTKSPQVASLAQGKMLTISEVLLICIVVTLSRRMVCD